MRKSIVALGAIGLTALSVAPALAGNSTTGAGAQKANLSVTSQGTSECKPATGSDVQGFAILNSTGQPGGTKSVLGEVSVKTQPDTTYSVFLEKINQQQCAPTAVATLTTNSQGNGNAHIGQQAPFGPGEYYVVLRKVTGNGSDLATPAVNLD